MVDPKLRFGGYRRKRHSRVLCAHFVRDQSYVNYRPEGTSDWLLIMTLGGSGIVRSRDTELSVKRGDVVCYHPDTPQEYLTDPNTDHWDLIWCHMDLQPSWVDYLQWPELAPGLIHLRITDNDLRADITAALMTAQMELFKWTATNEKLAVNAVERALLLFHLANPNNDEGPTINPKVHRALTFLRSNSHRAVSMSEMAAYCQCSTSRLSVLFKDETGMAPIQYHEMNRLHRSQHLLRETRLNVTKIAAAVGFDDPFYFSNRFRKLFGLSPRAYRNEQTAK